MQIPFIVEFVDGNKEKVVTGTPDFIAGHNDYPVGPSPNLPELHCLELASQS